MEARALSPGELTGSTLDDIVRLDRLISSDPFAERYAGRLVDSRRSVFVTVFNQQFIPDADAKKRVETARAKIGAPLPEQINTLLQVHLDKNPGYLIESEPRGPSIRDVLEERKELKWTEAVRITANLARAAQWLHENGTPHWQFHADSVYITRLAEGQVVVGDWVLEAVLPADSVERKLEEDPSTFAGYVDYMAPELASDTEKADIRSAVYALGCLLYEMILGRPPLPAQSAAEVLKRHQHEKPVRLSIAKGGGDLHPELDDILEMMLAKDPSKRFQIPMACVAALSNLVSESPDELAPPLQRASMEAEDDLYRTIDMESVDRDEVLAASAQTTEIPIDQADTAPTKPIIGAVSGTSQTRDGDSADQHDTAPTQPIPESARPTRERTETGKYAGPAASRDSKKTKKKKRNKDRDSGSRKTLLGNLGNLGKAKAEQEPEVEDSGRSTLMFGSGPAINAAVEAADAAEAEAAEAEAAEAASSEADAADGASTDKASAAGFGREVAQSGILKSKKIGKVAPTSGEGTDDASVDSDAPAAASPDDSLDGDPDEAQAISRTDISREFDIVDPDAKPTDETVKVTIGAAKLEEDRQLAEERSSGEDDAVDDPSNEQIHIEADEAKKLGLTDGKPNIGFVEAPDNSSDLDGAGWFAGTDDGLWDESYARDYAESDEKTNRTIKIALAALLGVVAIGFFVYFEYLYEPTPDETAVAEETVEDPVEEKTVDVGEIKTAFDESLEAGRVVSPIGNSALHYLEELKRHAVDQPVYEEARSAFVARARTDAVTADEAGDLRSARALAGYASQFAPEDEALKSMVADLQARFTGQVPATAPDAGTDAGLAAGEPDLGNGEPAEEPEEVAEVEPTPTPAPKPKPKKSPKPRKAPSGKAAAARIAKDARSAHTRGDLNQARKLYHDALTKDGTSSDILAGLGKVYFDQANYREAVKHQIKAVRYAPNRNDYRISLGQSYFRLGKYKEAINVWEKVLQRDPDNGVAKQYITLAKRKLGG